MNDWHIAGWEVLGRIARGSTADVLLARPDLTGEVTPAALSLGLASLEQRVVLKRLYPHLAGNEDFVRMFVDEVRLMARLRHDNIVDVYDLDEDGESFYAVVELVDGPSLSAALRLHHKKSGGAAVSIDVAATVVARICAALDVVHRATDNDGLPLELVHRDVNPANVLVGRDDVVKLADFGVAHSARGRKGGILAARDTNAGVLKGKASFLSPEQLRSGAADQKSDLWAVGVTLYALLSGRLPFVGDSDVELLDRIVHDDPPSLSSSSASSSVTLPPALTALTMALLSKDPAQRPASARDVAAAVAPFVDDGVVGRFVFGLGLPSLRGAAVSG